MGELEPHPGYRPCVGIMLLDRDRTLFIGRRQGPLVDAWQMPQGGIDPGETAEAAARRELLEEVGTDQAELIGASRYWYAYDLPEQLIPPFWGGRFRGQTQRWFAFAFTGDDRDIDLGRHTPEFDEWRWAAPEEVLELIVPFKRPVYEAVMREMGDLLQRPAGRS